MSISYDKQDKYLLVNLEGKVDNKTAPEIQSSILNESGSYGYIIIDMSKVDYMSSAGLRVLCCYTGRSRPKTAQYAYPVFPMK
jgi:anti-anti-sigma factor